ncbi:hypothetical protein BDZ85DRAFT_265877 [Elsinoe ampelina]|uniref:Secreted protein n=1 Tax=Elsinoe ampelina TaxID=302913 RepID=A0A6A6G5M0_9PEZI|nr:hypothetical protein BDZ85DRAFT_265877 [Elsinoe ampelina]
MRSVRLWLAEALMAYWRCAAESVDVPTTWPCHSGKFRNHLVAMWQIRNSDMTGMTQGQQLPAQCVSYVRNRTHLARPFWPSRCLSEELTCGVW